MDTELIVEVVVPKGLYSDTHRTRFFPDTDAGLAEANVQFDAFVKSESGRFDFTLVVNLTRWTNHGEIMNGVVLRTQTLECKS